MTLEQQKALEAIRNLIAYHKGTWKEGDGYTSNSLLVYITKPQAEIALRYGIPIGIRSAAQWGIGRLSGKPFRYITIPTLEVLRRWQSFAGMEPVPSIHAELPRRIQRRMREYILQIMEIECPDMLPPEKPIAPVLGTQGDLFSLLSIANRALCQTGQIEQAERMWRLVLSSGSYLHAIAVIREFVEFDEAPFSIQESDKS